MGPSAEARARTAPFEAAPNRRTMSIKPTSRKTTSVRTMSVKAAIIRATVRWMSPALVPGTCPDEDPVREPGRTVVAVGRASIRIIRVIAVSADRWPRDIAADAHSDPDLSLRVRERQGQ